ESSAEHRVADPGAVAELLTALAGLRAAPAATDHDGRP
ncbi:MAG: hypothetical protein AVDCRST_MAG35-1205, partial [uncultured Quadrisphaera sp.]